MAKKLEKQSDALVVEEEVIASEEEAIMSVLNEKGEEYYLGLVSRFLKNPLSLNAEELEDLKESEFINKVSTGIDALKVKKVTEEEAKQLEQAEASLRDYFTRIGHLEFQKNILMRSATILEEQKTNFLSDLGKQYGVKGRFSVDLNTLEIIEGK